MCLYFSVEFIVLSYIETLSLRNYQFNNALNSCNISPLQGIPEPCSVRDFESFM